MHFLNMLVLWIGWTVMAAGGVTLAVVAVLCAVEFAANQYCKGHDILRIAIKVREERKAALAAKKPTVQR